MQSEGGQHADLGRDHLASQRPVLALLISLGYPSDRPLTPIRKPDRRPFGEVVHCGGW